MPVAASCPRSQRSIQIKGRADEREMGERLWKIAERLAAAAGLLGVKSQVIGVAEHVFEKESRVFQSSRIGAPGPGQRFHQPERTHIERPFSAGKSVRSDLRIIAIDQSIGREA